MEDVLKLWQKMRLPQLKLKEPWYGYNLGSWSEENERQAELAVRGEYYQTGRVEAQRRQKVDQ